MSDQRDNRKTENKELEASVLYAIFKYGQPVFEIIANMINVEDFAFANYRQIYKILVDSFNKNNSLLSYQGLYNYAIGLPDTSDEDKVRIKTTLTDVKSFKIKEEDTISYCQQIKDHSNNRKLLKSLSQTVGDIGDLDTSEVIQALETKLDDLKKTINLKSSIESMSLKKDIEERISYLKHMKSNPEDVGVVWTGFRNIDDYNPPLKPGSFAMFQARTNMGKSMFLMGVALSNYCGIYSKSFHAPELKGKVKGIKVIIITIEMSASEYLFRMDSHISGYKHTENFALGNIIDTDTKVLTWKEKIAQFGNNDTDLIVYGVPENCSPAVVDKIITDNPFKPDLVVIDYVGDMISGLKSVSEYDWKSQAHLYTKMKQLARKHKCVIFSAQQTIRGAKKLSDETGSASDKGSQIADLLIAIEQTDYDKLQSGMGSDGNTIEGQLSIREMKVRSGVRLMTYILPEFHKMNWVERKSDSKLEAGNFKNIEMKEKKNPVQEALSKPTGEKFPQQVIHRESDINMEIGIEDGPVNLAVENPDALTDADIEAALSEIN